MKTIIINNEEYKVTRKTEKIREIIKLYNENKHSTIEEFYPKYEGNNSHYDRPCNEWVYSLQCAVYDAKKKLGGKYVRPIIREKHHCIMGFIIEVENKKYLLTFSNVGKEDWCIEL